MKRMTNDEIRKIEVNILSYVKSICKKNNLTYYLYAGTLVGAVLYGDFLPEDDDIDIILPRKDYDKLLSILDKSNKYKLFSPYNNKDYYYSFAKLSDKHTLLIEKSRVKIENLGVHIDIFPMDGIPNHFKKIYLFKMRIIKKLLLTKLVDKPKITKLRHYKYLIKYYIMMFIEKINKNKDNNYLALLIDKKAKKYDYDSSKYVSLVTYGSRNSNYIKKDDFSLQDVYYFNNDYYTGSKNSEVLLEKIYGKKNNTKKHHISHGFVAFFK